MPKVKNINPEGAANQLTAACRRSRAELLGLR